MNRKEKIQLLIGISKSKVKLESLKDPFCPTLDELVKIRECFNKNAARIALSKEESIFSIDFNSKGRLTLDHLTYPELYLLKYNSYPEK